MALTTGSAKPAPTWGAKAGFAPLRATEHRSLLVCSQAQEKRGKTHWAFTAPGPIACITCDTGTEEVAEKFMNQGKDIYVVNFKPPDKDRSKQDNEAEWAKIENAINAVIEEPNIRTLICDTHTEVWEMLRLARHGKLTQVLPHQYTAVNKEMRDTVKRIKARKNLNAVFIHKVKKEYRGGKAGGMDSWTGNWERAGFSDMAYLADVVVEHGFAKPGMKVPDGVEEHEFYTTIMDSRYQPEDLVGTVLSGSMCDFPTLAMMCFPDVDPEVWL